MNKLSLKVIITAVGGVLFFFVVNMLTGDRLPKLANRRLCEAEKRTKDRYLNGLVLSKFRNKEYDNTIKYLDFTSLDTLELEIFVLDHNKVFGELKQGDSIRKERESLLVQILRNGRSIDFALNYNCNKDQ